MIFSSQSATLAKNLAVTFFFGRPQNFLYHECIANLLWFDSTLFVYVRKLHALCSSLLKADVSSRKTWRPACYCLRVPMEWNIWNARVLKLVTLHSVD